MHPCAFYSRRLTPAESNYDISNRELLAVKLALEEWRHCLFPNSCLSCCPVCLLRACSLGDRLNTKGCVGYAGQVIQMYGCMCYIIILAWALLYLVSSFKSQLPWASCDNIWNTNSCIALVNNANWTRRVNSTSAATEFWERRVLSISKGIDEVGNINWEILLCLIAMWIICYFSVWKGVKSTGKVVYFTATFPYVMLLVLLIRGLTLPGAMQGVIFYLYPDFQRLLEPQVWMEAASQIIYSYSTGVGILTVQGSFNQSSNNCYRQPILINTVN
ncbi:sodium- and chloride-dependent GABA transporter 3-like [Neoarius graeffei]|uniref:sodium- and chloride-dependent GABA transporter 3-like n=1 Tax=Neoarius graeffei TaxID=443677 RepID=UPI00298C5A07|nr:sodium- and chloride-dependent GABA transporter 3-like [Neoarius graeffei]